MDKLTNAEFATILELLLNHPDADDLLQSVAAEAGIELGEYPDEPIEARSFADAGILTNNHGVVVQAYGGEFQVQLNGSYRADG